MSAAHQRRRAGRRGRRHRPGVDQQRGVAALERLEHRAEAVVAGRAGERVGGHAGAGEAAVEQPGQRRRIGLGEADRGPRAERSRQRGDAVVVGRQQRLGLGGGQRLDAERDRRRDQRAREPVGVRERRALVRVVVGEVDRRLRLAEQAQASSRRRRARASAARWRAAERVQQRLGPEVLVDVDGAGPR